MSSTNSEAFDSDRQHLGGVYAKALLGAVEKEGNDAEIVAALDSLVEDVFDKLPKFEAALASPRVAIEAKLDMIDKAFSGKAPPVLVNFLKVVARHGRLDCLRAIRRSARQLFNEKHGRIAVRIDSAHAMNAGLLSGVVEKLEASLGGKLDVTTRVDPALLGGLVVRVGDTVYDGSVSTGLERLREGALQQARQKIRQDAQRFSEDS